MISVLALVVTGLTSGAAQAAAAPLFQEYVALGDSWSADSTLTVSRISTAGVPLGCAQSVGNYPKQVAAAFQVKVFRDATCGSATTEALTAPQGVPFWEVNPPQFDRLTPTTDLVTLGIGGNDAGLAGAITSCLNVLPFTPPCNQRWVSGGVDQMSVYIAETAPRIVAAIDGIRSRSPRARILLVDYLQAVPEEGCWPVVPVLPDDAHWLRAKLEEFNTMLERVAATTRVQFVDTYTSSAGHDFCQAPGTNWIEGLTLVSSSPLGLAVPFHPNQLGADHQAKTVIQALKPNA